MPTSRTELILLAVIAQLDLTGPIVLPNGTSVTRPTDVTVDRYRRQPLNLEDLPRITVYPRDEDVTRATQSRVIQVTDRKLRIAVVARVKGTDALLDPLRQWIVAALLAPPGPDWFLSGLALSIDEDAIDWEVDEDVEGDYSVAATMLVIRYAAIKYDLTAPI